MRMKKEMLEKACLQWSPTQKCFHVSTVRRMLQDNYLTFVESNEHERNENIYYNSWICFGIYDSDMEAHEAGEELRNSVLYDKYVYFIEGENSLLIKIGSSTDPKKRLRELQVGSSEPLRLIKTAYGDNKREKEIHEKFKNQRIKGEWFKQTKELKKFIHYLI